MENRKIKTDTILLIGLFLLFNAVLTFWTDYYNFFGKYLYYASLPLIFIVLLIQKYNLFRNKFFLNYLLFVIYAVFISIVFFNRTDNLNRLILVCFFHIPLMLGIDCYCKNDENLKRLLNVYILSCIIMSIAIIFAGSYGNSSFRYGWSVTGNQPNTPALNLGLAIAVTFYNYLTQKKNKFLSLLLSFFFSVVVFLTGSRKMLIFIFFVFISYLLFTTKNFKKTLRNIFLVFFLIVCAYVSLIKIPVLYNTIGYRIFNLNSDSSASDRNELRSGALQYFKKSPIIGNGVDTYKEVNSFGLYAHDNYAELLSGVGLIGLIIYYGFKFKYTFILFINRKNSDNLLFAIIMMGLFIIEIYNVNYLQWAIFAAYTICYSKYRLFLTHRSD